MNISGIRLIGLSHTSLDKLLLTLGAVGGLVLTRYIVVRVMNAAASQPQRTRVLFWIRQGTSLAVFVLAVLIATSIWFDDPSRLSTVVGLASAGIAIAAQKAVTSFAGYLVIMRGRTFTVGDRIKMGGVRGDVIALGFLQTRILEMGQPAEVNEQEDPGMWVRARQFTGRIVTVTNDKVFEEPVYNFTREFPFIWEELHVPVPYRADRALAEQILLAVVRETTAPFRAENRAARDRLTCRYAVELENDEPCVFWRLTDNWLELTARFVVPEHGVREIKDRITRALLAEFDARGIEIASATMEISRVAPIHIERRQARS